MNELIGECLDGTYVWMHCSTCMAASRTATAATGPNHNTLQHSISTNTHTLVEHGDRHATADTDTGTGSGGGSLIRIRIGTSGVSGVSCGGVCNDQWDIRRRHIVACHTHGTIQPSQPRASPCLVIATVHYWATLHVNDYWYV